ncbi:MAG TPA: hypothetical protein PK867_19940 [Pirellulales bacterium]|nr:hypothetical protein [Pirellulales bacterium]
MGFKPNDDLPWTCETEHEVKPKPVGDHPESWMEDLSAALKEVATQAMNVRPEQSIIVPILTFAPARIEPAKTIYVVVQPTYDGYLATLFDANLAMSGDTQEEAVANLKALILDVFDELEEEKDILAPGMALQFAALQSLLKRS